MSKFVPASGQYCGNSNYPKRIKCYEKVQHILSNRELTATQVPSLSGRKTTKL